jgi:Arc/MetJ family transcription regulator
MRTNIVLNDELISEAFKYSDNISTKKELVDVALKEYVENHKRKNLKDLFGKISFSSEYNYKNMRNEE